jgi:hypothetical protein
LNGVQSGVSVAGIGGIGAIGGFGYLGHPASRNHAWVDLRNHRKPSLYVAGFRRQDSANSSDTQPMNKPAALRYLLLQ